MSGISYRKAVYDAADRLQKCGVDNPQHDSLELLMAVSGFDQTQYFVHCEEIINDRIYSAFQDLVVRRADREPLQHIIGNACFWGRNFLVNRDVLVPRQDTEVLIEQALAHIHTGNKVLDMCTGSGCIIITLACERQLSKAVGVDLSEKALEIAKINAMNHLANVMFIKSDLFEELQKNRTQDIQSVAQYDVIVSNPPYIEHNVIDTLSDEVRLFEPLMALDGGEDGLKFYKKITKQAVNFLKLGGWLFYEIGSSQAQYVKNIMIENGFSDISVVQDLAGLDRVVMGRRSEKVGKVCNDQ